MVCYTPLKAYRKPDGGIGFNPSTAYLDRALTFKCGQCEGCRLAYSREWAIRCYHETKMHEDNCYVTLTYSTPNLPENRTLIKSELSQFMRRLRHSQGYGIRFFGCGEYGDELGRPHYHAILFNWKPNDLRRHVQNKSDQWIHTSRQLDKIWSFGHTYTGEATFQSAAYVARYILKKINGQMSEPYYKTVDPETGEIITKIPEFTGQSLGGKNNGGIGKSWYEKYGNTDAHNHDEIIMPNGRKYPVPRYYDKLLEKIDPPRYARIKRARLRNARDHAENNTPARLKIRARVQQKKTQRLLRDQHDKGYE